MKRPTQISAIALAALVAATAPAAVIAQTEPAPMTQEVTGAELDAFAADYESVIEIDAEFVPLMEQAADEEAQQLLLEEAQIAKVEAVEATDGIDVDRYVEILTLAQTDPALTAQIGERLVE